MSNRYRILVFFLLLLSFGISNASQPEGWQLGFQAPASPVMDYINEFHNFMLILMFVIVLFVSALIFYVLLKFRRIKNPEPSKSHENIKLEIFWTIIPIIIVIAIAFPSLRVLKYEEQIPESEFTIKVIGHQWYWSYEYPDHNNIGFDSNIKYDLDPGELRLLAVDNDLVVPVNTNIRIQVTASDVIHSWAIPSLGVKQDAIPGRLNETWINVRKEGKYYGQCSELCGILHGFMPIVISAVSQDDFNQWIDKKNNNNT